MAGLHEAELGVSTPSQALPGTEHSGSSASCSLIDREPEAELQGSAFPGRAWERGKESRDRYAISRLTVERSTTLAVSAFHQHLIKVQKDIANHRPGGEIDRVLACWDRAERVGGHLHGGFW